MNKNKVLFVTSVSFMLIGAIIFTGVMSVLKWDFTKLNTTKYENNVHVVDDQFKNLLINTNTADVVFLKSDDGTCKIECVEYLKEKHSVEVEEQTLKITITDNRKWYDHITFFSFVVPKIKVYLPQSQYGALSIAVSTGDVEIPNDFTFESIDIKGSTGCVKSKANATDYLNVKLSTGNVDIGDVDVRYTKYIKPKNVNITVTTGDVKLWRTGAQEKLTVNCSTGNVWLCITEAPYVFVKTTTGNVEGNLYTAPKFITHTNTGSIKVPQAKTDDVFEITTNTGDIYFKVVK